MYLVGNATSMQKKQIEEWIKEEKNLHQYYAWLMEWEIEHPQFIPDTKKAVERFLLKASDQPYQDENKSEKKNFYQTYRKLLSGTAASVILLIALFICFENIFFKKSYKTDYGEVKSFHLEDGSSVTLNSNSLLVVPRFGFGKNSRKVFLKGEAVFEVRHFNDAKKFIVSTADHMDVEVIGTQFSVLSRSSRSIVKLERGLVKVNLYKDKVTESVVINPGDIVSIKEKKLAVRHSEFAKDFFAWKEHRFVFDNTPLSEAILTLEETFGIHIIIEDPSLRNKIIEGSFKAENADDILNAFSQIYSMKIEKTGGQIKLVLVD